MQRFIDLLDDELDSLDLTDTVEQNAFFRLTLDKTQVFRVAGNYSNALSIFGSLGGWTFNSTQSMRAQYWQCICDAENQFFTGVITNEDYAQIADQCNINYAGYNYKWQGIDQTFPGVSIKADLASLKAFPSPMQDILTLQIDGGYFGDVDYVLLTSSGKKIQTGVLKWEGTSRKQLDLSKIGAGLYFLTLDFMDKGKKTITILKE